MNYNVVISDQAALDIASIFNWYEAESQSAGIKVLREIYRSINNLKSSPLVYPLAYKSSRRLVIQKYPYVVYFAILNETVTVRRVFHQHSDHANDIRHQP